MAAWSIDGQPYQQLSKKYDVDINIFGIEFRGGFTQEMEFHKGKFIRYEVDDLDYDDKDEVIRIPKKRVNNLDDRIIETIYK